MHMAQLMPLPLTVSCFSKIQIGFTFLVPAHPGSPGKRAVKRVCVLQLTLTFTPILTLTYSTNSKPKPYFSLILHNQRAFRNRKQVTSIFEDMKKFSVL